MESKSKVVTAISIAVLAGLVGGLIDHALFPRTVVDVQTVEKTVDRIVNVPVEKIVEKIVEVPVEVVKEVSVSDNKLEVVEQHIYDNDGKVEYLTDDLDEDEVGQIVDRIVFINDVKAMAVQDVRDNGLSELDREVYTNGTESVTFDEDDVDRFRVEDDQEDITVDDVDFKDYDAKAFVTVRVEQDNKSFDVKFKVTFKDGQVDDTRVDTITKV